MSLRVGLISDTHGLVRPEALAALRGSDRILHAGDVGGPHVLAALEEIAPVVAVRGNVDEPDHIRRRRGRRLDPEWAAALPAEAAVTLEGVEVHLVHDLAASTAGEAVEVLVVGHSHVPRIEHVEGVLLVNPGSAGPRRFRLPVTVGRLEIADGDVAAEIVGLSV